MRALILALLIFLPVPALAQLKVCNETDVLHRVAISYESQKTWVSEGWWTFKAGECGTVMSDPLDRKNYYYKVHAEGHDYKGKYGFCTGKSPFKILGDTKCEERGFQREMFLVEDTGPTQTSWTITLSGAPVDQPASTSLSLPSPELDYIDYHGAFQAGSLGEPSDTIARFIGCHDDGDSEFCRFSADGVDWLVYPSDANYSETFTAISLLTPGQRVNLKADIINFNDASVEIAVSRIEAITQANDLDRIYFALQGRFTDPKDARGRAEVIGNTLFELYDDTQVSAYRFHVADNCDGTPQTGPALMLSEPESGWSNCAILNYVGTDGFSYTEMGMLQGPSYRR
ncbi:DUF1036 domain-containing protein [Planktotalea sp.]|uniref:DUF1036 domain-containing protein n=1 Tax=Planktotalea sp. TaxID=2029877 RepID=UPI003D6BCDB6